MRLRGVAGGDGRDGVAEAGRCRWGLRGRLDCPYLVSSFVLCTVRYLYRRWARAASWVVYEVRALHGTSPHPARLRGSPAGLFAHLPHPLYVLRCFASGRTARSLPTRVELQGSIGRLPLGVGTLAEENFVHGHEPSGISVRILGEGSPEPHGPTRRKGRTKRPCGRFHVSGASRTRE